MLFLATKSHSIFLIFEGANRANKPIMAIIDAIARVVIQLKRFQSDH